MKSILSAAFFIIFVCYLLSKCNQGENKPLVFDPEKEATGAYVEAEMYIKQNLKSPSTAEFPFLGNSERVHYLGDSVFVVRSYVDAKNSFGVPIRSNWMVKLKRNSTSGSNDFDIIESDVK